MPIARFHWSQDLGWRDGGKEGRACAAFDGHQPQVLLPAFDTVPRPSFSQIPLSLSISFFVLHLVNTLVICSSAEHFALLQYQHLFL